MTNCYKYRSHCPINQTVELLGDNWSMLIIRDMLFFSKTSYGEFFESSEGISTNILATRLKQLEANGIIEKYIDKKDRKKSIYLLTEKGLGLAPLLAEMLLWGYEHGDKPEEFSSVAKKLKTDREAVLSSVLEKYRKQRLSIV